MISSKGAILRAMKEKGILKSQTVMVCLEACIPSKGLHVDYLLHYYMNKNATGVYLYSYDADIQYVKSGCSK